MKERINFGVRRSLPPPGRAEAETSALQRRVYPFIRCVSVDGWSLLPARRSQEDPLRDLVEPLLEELDLEDPTLAWGEEWDDLEEEYRRLTGEMEAVEEVEQWVG